MAGERGIFLNGSNSIEINSANISIGSTGNLGVTGSFFMNGREIIAGIPTGGVTGQVITKTNTTPFNFSWSNVVSGPTGYQGDAYELYDAVYKPSENKIYYYIPQFGSQTFNGTINDLAYTPDGGLYVGGGFTQYGNIKVNRIVRLNPDSTIDNSFYSGGASGGFDINVFKVASFTNGDLFATGSNAGFLKYGINSSVKLAKVKSDGTYDSSFIVTTGITVASSTAAYSIIPLDDGGVILTGNFTAINGSGTTSGVARLSATGAINSTFSSNTAIALGAVGQVRNASVLLPDGKFLVYETNTAGNISGRIRRLNIDGTNDATFVVGAGAEATNGGGGGNIQGVIIQEGTTSTNYKLLLYGNATAFWKGTSLAGGAAGALFRVDSTGTLDTTFNRYVFGAGTTTVSGFYDEIYEVFFIGGNFTTYNSVSYGRILKLSQNGTPVSGFPLGTGFGNTVNKVIKDPQGEYLLCGGAFTTYNGSSAQYLTKLDYSGNKV